MKALPTVVFVDDEERILRSLRMLFRGRADIHTTTSGRQALDWVRTRRVHVVVSDQRMPEMGGVEVLRGVALASPSTMRILLTGYADLDAVTASVNDGEIYRFIEKPWDGPRLVTAVVQAAEIANEEFLSTPAPRVAETAASRIAPAARVLVLDATAAIATTVRGILPESIETMRTSTVEETLGALAAHDVAVIVVVLSGDAEDTADAIKQLKRLRPATLVVAVSSMRDSRLAIGLINEGQIFRFLLAPPVRELLRRSLLSALDRHAQLQATPRLLKRHDVLAATRPDGSLSARLLDAWRRLRDATAG